MASADIQAILDTQPPELPFQQPLVTATGLPTQHLINWNFYQSQWFRNNVIKADQRIDTVKATADNASAAVTTESNARVAADEALAEQITTVSAKANNATANGQIYFAAHAAPAGSLAAYGIYLTAGSSFTGMELLAMSDGTSAIGMTAGSFVFTDSGTTKQVLTYYSGQFHFTSDVAIDGNLILNGTIVTGAIADNAITNVGTAQATANTTATAYFSARAGDKVLVLVTVVPGAHTSSGNLPGYGVRVSLNGGSTTDIVMTTPNTTQWVGGSPVDNVPTPMPTTRQLLYVSSVTGTNYITAICGDGADVFVTALALSK